MGFFGVMGRLLQGKPAFVDPKFEQAGKTGTEAQAFNPMAAHRSPEDQVVDSQGRKIIPELKIEHLKSHRNGNQMMTVGWVTNTSTHRVRVDDIHILKQKVVLHRELGPGEAHEIQFYHGPVAVNDYEHKAQIAYRLLENGDCFRADYNVEYNRDQDGMYTIEELHPEHPIHDV